MEMGNREGREIKCGGGGERRHFGNENASQMNSGVMNVPGSIPR